MGNQVFFINYNENTSFWGESFNWGVLAEETPPLSALVMSGHCYKKLLSKNSLSS